MSILTNWGYKLTSLDKLPDLLTSDDFNALTANKFKGDSRIGPAISAAQSAIRNYVGWHLSSEQPCEAEYTLLSRNVAQVNHDMLIQLPAMYLTGITSVMVAGNSITAFTFETNGILRLYDIGMAGVERYSKIVIDYTAGLPDGLMDGIKELVAHRVTHALVQPNGVQSEAAGGVSVTYNSTWINNARATALPDDNKEVLAPYKLQGVF